MVKRTLLALVATLAFSGAALAQENIVLAATSGASNPFAGNENVCRADHSLKCIGVANVDGSPMTLREAIGANPFNEIRHFNNLSDDITPETVLPGGTIIWLITGRHG